MQSTLGLSNVEEGGLNMSRGGARLARFVGICWGYRPSLVPISSPKVSQLMKYFE